MIQTSDGRNVLYGAPAQNSPVAPVQILLVAPAQTPKFVESNTGFLRLNRNLYTYASGIYETTHKQLAIFFSKECFKALAQHSNCRLKKHTP
ncbi:hypothetical protein OUZ56_009565 [Daphnia magna]|uniref:Uncharacterized protein n=1 Tax=Daphnia magna TaxID=35525 RepID=A0ABR0AGT2_9CRUS|nr:hypothetical protein OUZ56_009565 [Daphnia magna]